jgi:hypothetical protein
MPAWLEILINLIGYGGFIAIAMYHRSPSEKLPEALDPLRRRAHAGRLALERRYSPRN